MLSDPEPDVNARSSNAGARARPADHGLSRHPPTPWPYDPVTSPARALRSEQALFAKKMLPAASTVVTISASVHGKTGQPSAG